MNLFTQPNCTKMKKILLAFDGTQFSEGAFNFARQLNYLRPILLTGVFIPQLSHSSLWSYSTGMAGPSYMPLPEDDDADAINENIARFEQSCKDNCISYNVHKEFFDFALPELKKETRFADLMIISSEKFYQNSVGESPEDYLKEVLHVSECPVVLVPEKFEFPQKNILAYNGSESSVFAIKQFAYLFPELCNQETLLVYANENNDEIYPFEKRIKELVQEHFMDIKLLNLNSDEAHHFSDWVYKNKNCHVGKRIVWSFSYFRNI